MVISAAKFRQTIGLIRFRPFDVSTVDGRTQERYRRVALTAGAGMLSKVFSVVAALIYIPLALNYLGAERYGMWMVISSFIAMLSFADLGIGNGLLNAIAAAHGLDDWPMIRSYISSGFFVLVLIALTIILVVAAAYPFVPWYKIFNVTSDLARGEARQALAVFFLCFALSVPFSVVQRVQMGLQMGFAANLWQCLGSVLALIWVVAAILLKEGLPWLVLALVGGPLIVSILNTIIFFGVQRVDIRPSIPCISRRAISATVRTGMLFLFLQIVASVSYGADNIIIAQTLGASAIAGYAVPEKMFSIIPMILGMVLVPFWPAYGEALSRGDYAWVRRTLGRSFGVAVAAATVLAGGLVVFGPWLLQLWVGRAIAPSFALLLGLGCWKIVEAGGTAVAMFLNGAHIVTFQLIVGVVAGLAIISFKIALVLHYGVPAIPWGATIAYLIFAAIPTAFFIKGRLAKYA
ncbi:MAG TPA: oligosaccharide flippase family protein [Aliidongia sp.]|nr:oligosaccharide flippase family protein [Aliidongia sp.]